MDTTERGDREWKQAQRQGDFLDNSSTQKTKGGPKLVLSPKGVTALRPLKDRHQFFYIVRLVCKPILQAKWSGFFAFGSISNFILVMLIILTNILITFFTPFISFFFVSIFELPYTPSKWPILIGVFKILEFSHPPFLIPPRPPFPKFLPSTGGGGGGSIFFIFPLFLLCYLQVPNGFLSSQYVPQGWEWEGTHLLICVYEWERELTSLLLFRPITRQTIF